MDFNEFNGNAPNKRTFGQKMRRVFERQGLYIVLLLCLAIIGATAYITLRNNKNQIPQAEVPPKEQSAPIEQSTDQTLESAINSVNNAIKSPTPSITPNVSPTAKPTTKPKVRPAMLPAPFEGTVILAFADNTLLYSKTLKQWTTHPGIDLAAPEGTSVKAIAAGVVEKVENDPLMGNKIVIKHSGGLSSVYANLATLPALKAGDSVKSAQEIGKVGNSAISEGEDEPHLHLELYVNDKAVDPASRIAIVTELPVK